MIKDLFYKGNKDEGGKMVAENTNNTLNVSGPNNGNTKHFTNPYQNCNTEDGEGLYSQYVISKIKEKFENPPRGYRFVLLQGNLGAGKTNTLKKIQSCPGDLGGPYIPIYLDLKKFIGKDMKGLLLAFYQDIIEKLNKTTGITVPHSLASENINRKTGTTTEAIVLAVESCLPENGILLLIFDEFDDLLENIDIMVINEIIQYLKHIEKSWKKFALILAGNKRMRTLTSSEIVKDLFKTAEIVDIESELDNDTIKMIITKPAEGRILFDNEALEKIIYYSGKNLYFQKLICSEIDRYFKQERVGENISICRVDAVKTVVEQILSEHRPEFAYAWENKLNIETRLIASALADSHITETAEPYYYLKKDSLLDDLLGDGVAQSLKKLENYGYLREFKDRRFNGYPFLIPLYGEWIHRQHPFFYFIIENIGAFLENMGTIAERLPILKLISILNDTTVKWLSPENKKTAVDLLQGWNSLKTAVIKDKKNPQPETVKTFLRDFFLFLDLNIKTLPDDVSIEPFSFILVDIRKLDIGSLNKAYCSIQNKPDLSSFDVIDFQRIVDGLTDDTRTTLTFFFYFKSSPDVLDLIPKLVLNNIIAMSEADLITIILAKEPRKTFWKLLLERLSLYKISPYHTEGPAKAIFSGRDIEIDQIVTSTNSSFTIVGARRIGKSSLLIKIRQLLEVNYDCIYMDLLDAFSKGTGYKHFLKRLAIEMQAVLHRTVDLQRFPLGYDINRIPVAIQEVSNESKRKLVFVFDEVDSLVEFDKRHGQKLLKVFRTMSQKGICQFIFAGFKSLYDIRRDLNSPFYNFAKEIRLEPLEEEAALYLITKPMDKIGVNYANPANRKIILENTASHPNLLQYFCIALIKKIEKHKKIKEKRTILETDIDEVIDNEYEDYVFDEVYMFSSNLGRIERLILILMAESNLQVKGYRFSRAEIKNQLNQAGIELTLDRLNQHLIELVMRFILVDKSPDIYSFALPEFPNILRKRTDEDYKQELIEEIKKHDL